MESDFYLLPGRGGKDPKGFRDSHSNWCESQSSTARNLLAAIGQALVHCVDLGSCEPQNCVAAS